MTGRPGKGWRASLRPAGVRLVGIGVGVRGATRLTCRPSVHAAACPEGAKRGAKNPGLVEFIGGPNAMEIPTRGPGLQVPGTPEAIAGLSGRLDALERENAALRELARGFTARRRYVARGFFGLLFLLVTAAVVTSEGADGPQRSPKMIEAQGFLVGDAEGRERARLAVGDAEGRVRAQISVGPGGTPGIRLLDPSQKAEIGSAVSGTRPGLILNDRTGHPRAGLSVQDDGSPLLSFRNQQGKLRLVLDCLPDGTPGLTFRDEQEYPRLSAVVFPGGVPGLNLLGPLGEPRAVLHAGSDGGVPPEALP